MTNKDASGILKTEAISHLIPEVREALWMGASALEEEHCGDYITKRVAIDIVDCYSESRSNVEDVTQDIISDIMASPPVTPKQTEITLESAIDYLHSIGWLQKHDKELTESAQKQRTGHWIDTGWKCQTDTDEILYGYGCSDCGAISFFRKYDNKILGGKWCHYCGAMMVEPQESEG